MVNRPGTVVNISGATPVDDPEYRYKMPVVYGKIEGRGNGIKTVIPNISDVATSLHRAPGEVNKFFGTELGAQTTYSTEVDRAVVNGAHTDATLQSLIHRYVEIFVLCPNCGLPETDYKIKNECIYHKCAACGAKDMVDMSHKLCTYILAQNKKAKKEAKSKDKSGKGKKEDKKSKKGKKDKDSSDEDKKSKKTKKSKKDKKKDKKEKSNGDGAGAENYLEEAVVGKEEDDFAEDGDELSVGSDAVDDAGALNLAVEGARKFLDKNPDASEEEILEVVTNQQMASALKSHDKLHIFIRAAITPDFFKDNEVEKYAPVVAKITNGKPIMERHLIAALEFISLDKPKNFPVLLKQFYDADALEEDTILEWAVEGRNEYTLHEVDEESRAILRGEAEPVVVWLQDAESDEEDSDSDE